MSISTGIVTAEQLLRMPRGRYRYELVEGELRTMSPAGSEHGVLVLRITVPLATYVDAKQLGIVFGAETGFVLSEDPDTVLAPDVAFVRSDRIPASGIPKSYWPGPPDLAVEVVSPSDTFTEVDEKVQRWLSSGAREVWVVNPRGLSAMVYRSSTDIVSLSKDDVLDGGEVVPGFRFPVKEIFAAP